MSTYWFVLGREPLLSAAELVAKFNLSELSFAYSSSFLKTALPSLNATTCIAELGGTVKIAEELFTDLPAGRLLPQLEQLLEAALGKITFGFSWYGSADSDYRQLEDWGKELKKSLKAKGRSVRYIYKREAVLSSVTVDKNGLHSSGFEFILENKNGLFSVARTVAVQPFEALSHRDFGRPGRDSESGMLPPKLALMLINLTRAKKDASLLDPFCGSGTILTEALLAGYTNLIGTDLSEKAIADCKQNLAWHRAQHPTLGEPVTLVADVTKLSSTITSRVAAIATEPYMGPPQTGRETEVELKKIVDELTNLYTLAFTQFAALVESAGTIVFIIPRFEKNHFVISISDSLVPKLAALGFIADPLLPAKLRREPYALYQRDNQRVAREIWRFTIKKPSR